ncbi:MAG: hypothetical protein KKC03_13940 [Bacteroidetes bacterium]|nr:hypothetical protein [Bacteroidota bacterium]
MKLNKAYYVSKVDELICAIDWKCDEPNERKFEAIVRQITRDGAKAQKVADRKAVKKLKTSQFLAGQIITIIDALAAIKSATVEATDD